jgi:uncharacterized protein (TIGR03067 family)
MRRTFFCIGSALVALLGVWVSAAQEGRDKKTELEGTWEIVAVSFEGDPYDEEEIKESSPVRRLVFKGKKLISLDEDGKVFSVSRFTLNPKQKPRELDVECRDFGHPIGVSMCLGIYQLDGDTLTLSWYAGPVLGRPKDFNGGEGSRQKVVTLKRVK